MTSPKCAEWWPYKEWWSIFRLYSRHVHIWTLHNHRRTAHNHNICFADWQTKHDPTNCELASSFEIGICHWWPRYLGISRADVTQRFYNWGDVLICFLLPEMLLFNTKPNLTWHNLTYKSAYNLKPYNLQTYSCASPWLETLCSSFDICSTNAVNFNL